MSCAKYIAASSFVVISALGSDEMKALYCAEEGEGPPLSVTALLNWF
jgi:hypothetical protein